MERINTTIRKILLASSILIACFAVFVMFNNNQEAKADINPMLNFTGKVTDADSVAVADSVYNFSFGLYTTATSGTAIWSEDLTAANLFSATISGVSSGASTTTYTYTGDSNESTLRVGQYLTNATTDEYALISDYDTTANTVTVVSATAWTIGEGVNNRPRTVGGVVKIDLGSVSSPASVNFNQTLYLQVTFNSEAMQPRKLIVPVAQAFNADKLDGYDASDFANIADDETITGEWDFSNVVDIATSSATTALTVTQSGSGDIINLFSGSNEVLTVLDSGNIGIGTSAPTEKLHLNAGNFLQTPGDPVTKGNWDPDDDNIMNGAHSVYVSGKYAYVTGRYSSNLAIVDISDPSNPTTIGNWDPDDPNIMSFAYLVYIAGKYAYVIGYHSDNLAIVDISDPSNPTTVGNWDPNNGNIMNAPRSVYISGKYAYVAGSSSDNLVIIDISDPTNPTMVGNWDPDDDNIMNAPYSVYVSGKYAYVAGGSSNNLAIVDISDPSNPTITGNWYPNDIDITQESYSVYVSGKYAYVAGGSSDNLAIVNISDPSNPTTVGNWDPDDTNIMDAAYSVYVSGKYAYVAGGYSNNLAIVDISDPSNPTIIGNWDPNDDNIMDDAYSVYVSGKYAYVIGYQSDNLAIVDISGLDVPSAHIGDLAVGTIDVWENMNVANNLYVGNGLNVGPGGMLVQGQGAFSKFATTSLSNIYALAATSIDSNTASVVDILNITHMASSTAADNIGTGLLFSSEDSSGSATSTGRIASILTDVTAATPASALAFYTKNTTGTITERLRIDASGNVGIGTTTPLTKLSVQGTAGEPVLNIASSTGASLLYVDESGNVGIGTVTPTEALAIGEGGSLRIGSNDVGTESDIYIGSNAVISAGNSMNFIIDNNNNNADTLHFAFLKNAVGTTGATELVRIQEDGNVGIGTTSPYAQLSVHRSSTGSATDPLFAIASSTASATTTHFVIMPSGRVGIGTAAPSQELDLIGNLELENTTSENTGVIYKEGDAFIHDFSHPTGNTAIPAGKNTFIGRGAGNFTMGSTATIVSHGSYNTGMGYQTLAATTIGYNNVGVGYQALQSATTGYSNVGVGYQALRAATTGAGNIGIGWQALETSTGNSHFNVGVGYNALYSVTSGDENVGVGLGAGTSITTGSSNIMIGRYAGVYHADGSTPLVHPEKSIYIGEESRAYNDNDDNSIVIGYQAIGIGANTVVLGNDNIVTTALKGNVGIGTTTPYSKLTVWGDGTSGVSALEVVDSASSTLFTVLDNGNVGIGTAGPVSRLDLSGGADGTLGAITLAQGDAFDKVSKIIGYSINTNEKGLKLHTYNSADITAMTILGAGFVGIGTTIPSAQLEVQSSSSGVVLNIEGQNVDDTDIAEIHLGKIGSVYAHIGVQQAAGGAAKMFYIDTASTDKALTILNNGNVGIGTTSPYSKLTIWGDGTGTGKLMELVDSASTTRMVVLENGNVGIGTTSPYAALSVVDTGISDDSDIIAVSTSTSGAVFRVTGYGNVYADGSFTPNGADYAEYFWTSDTDLESGEVVCVDVARDNAVKRCERGADGNVMGIVSSNPAIIGNAKAGYEDNINYKIIGMLGQVEACVSNENGEIRPGDSLTSASSTVGCAMRAKPGDPTVGVALEAFAAAAPRLLYSSLGAKIGVINVLISRRNKSLTVEAVEARITDRIAAMEIEDEVNILIANAIDNVDFDEEVADAIDPKLLLLTTQLTVATDDMTGEIVDLGFKIADLRLQITDLRSQISNFQFPISNSIIIDENGNIVITNDSEYKVDLANSTSTPSIAVVEIITATTTEQTAFVVNQQGDKDVADFRADDVSIVNIADTGKVTIIGEILVDGRIMVCSGGACGSTLDNAVDKTMGDMGVEGTIVAGAFEGYCEDGYIWVPGSAKYGTLPGFCVETQKHKNTKTQKTIINISQGQAILTCQEIGNEYHLISENEWLTIAENIIRVAENDVNAELEGLQLATSTLIYANDTPNNANIASSSIAYILTNGNVIYDLAGAIAEWTDMTVTRAGLPEPVSNEWLEYYEIIDYNGFNIAPPYYYSSANGIGRVLTGDNENGLRGFVRGFNGIYSLDLSNSPADATSTIGFRCAK